MSSLQHEAEGKFWETPELAEKILPFLSLEATKRLAQAHKLTRTILQGELAWSKLMRRSCQDLDKAEVTNLVGILKLLKEPTAHLRVLLDVICESSGPLEEFLPDGSTQFIQMGSDRHPDSHQITPFSFELLEQVESVFGTTEQAVEMVKIRVVKAVRLFR